MINIVIAEDNLIAFKTMEEKLSPYDDIVINYRAENGRRLLDLLAQNAKIDLILMDLEMPGMNGIEATEVIKQLYPHIKIVVITVFDDDDYIFNAIKAGADSYILKETKAAKIYETLNDTMNGGSVMSPSIALKTLQLLKNTSHSETQKIVEKDREKIILTERETGILEQLCKGFSNKIIAENLFISPFTVKRHIENIYQKLKIKNRIELMEKARNNGLIE